MAVGESYIRIATQRSESYKPGLKVDKKTEQKILAEIKRLTDQRTKLYENDDITDEELKILVQPIDEKINQLIDSMYYTKEEWKKIKGLR